MIFKVSGGPCEYFLAMLDPYHEHHGVISINRLCQFKTGQKQMVEK